MNKILTTSVSTMAALMLSIGANAAPDEKKTGALTCDQPEVLNALAQNIAQTNQLSPKLKFEFDQIKTIQSVQKNGKTDVKCSTYLKLVNADGSVADQLTIAYEMQQMVETTMSFEPQR